MCLPSEVFANPQNTNIAGPSASATGNVTNQAVQVLQGPFPQNAYGVGVACSGPSLTIAPFVMGNSNFSHDPGTYQSYGGTTGVTLGVSIPLDAELQDLCKARARANVRRQELEADKAQLDFELVRALRCGEMKKAGIQFHPESPYSAVCADIIVLNP